MHARPVLLAFAAAAALTGEATAQSAPVTAAELDGRWLLTFRANPPGTKGVKLTFTDDAGRKTTTLPIDLEVRAAGGRLAGCTITMQGKPASRKATPCRLDRGAFVVDIAGDAGGRNGVMSLRLARSGAGAYAGPAKAKVSGLPLSVGIGSATLARAS